MKRKKDSLPKKKKVSEQVSKIRRALENHKKGEKVDLSFTNVRLVTCYVCKNKIPKDNSKKTLYIGKDMYRCVSCYTGSESWMKHRKNSESYIYFIDRQEENNDKNLCQTNHLD